MASSERLWRFKNREDNIDVSLR